MYDHTIPYTYSIQAHSHKLFMPKVVLKEIKEYVLICPMNMTYISDID